MAIGEKRSRRRAKRFGDTAFDLKAKALVVERGSASPAVEAARKLGIQLIELGVAEGAAAGEFSLGELPAAPSSEVVARYERSEQASQLKTIFDAVLRSDTARGSGLRNLEEPA